MQRLGSSKSLQDIEVSIRQVQNTEELLTMLASLLDVAETSVDDSRIDSGKMNQMAEYLAEIRHLLGTLGSGSALQVFSRAAMDMAGRYRDLEGRVKEIRNDRASNGKGP